MSLTMIQLDTPLFGVKCWLATWSLGSLVEDLRYRLPEEYVICPWVKPYGNLGDNIGGPINTKVC